CAPARSPPSSEYLLFDDHPASATPYTPIDVTPRMINNPMFSSGAIWRGMSESPMITGLPNGMIAMDVSAQITASMGAAIYKGRYTCGGVRSSLNRNLIPSANGCNSPNG